MKIGRNGEASTLHCLTSYALKLLLFCLIVQVCTLCTFYSLLIRNIQLLLTTASAIAKTMNKGNPVLVHGDTGCDTALQLTSLVQIIMDPHCRTVKGCESYNELCIPLSTVDHQVQYACNEIEGQHMYPRQSSSITISQHIMLLEALWACLITLSNHQPSATFCQNVTAYLLFMLCVIVQTLMQHLEALSVGITSRIPALWVGPQPVVCNLSVHQSISCILLASFRRLSP